MFIYDYAHDETQDADACLTQVLKNIIGQSDLEKMEYEYENRLFFLHASFVEYIRKARMPLFSALRS
jgi:hypothetical protein